MDLSFSESWLNIVLDGSIAIAMAVAIFYIGRWFALLVAYLVARSLKARATEATLTGFIVATIRVVLTFVALLIALDSLWCRHYSTINHLRRRWLSAWAGVKGYTEQFCRRRNAYYR